MMKMREGTPQTTYAERWEKVAEAEARLREHRRKTPTKASVDELPNRIANFRFSDSDFEEINKIGSGDWGIGRVIGSTGSDSVTSNGTG